MATVSDHGSTVSGGRRKGTLRRPRYRVSSAEARSRLQPMSSCRASLSRRQLPILVAIKDTDANAAGHRERRRRPRPRPKRRSADGQAGFISQPTSKMIAAAAAEEIWHAGRATLGVLRGPARRREASCPHSGETRPQRTSELKQAHLL